MTYSVLTTSLDLLRTTAAAVPADRLDDPTPCPDWTVAQVLLHAAADQHAWASAVAGSQGPSYNPFAPPPVIDGTVDELVGSAVSAAQDAWARVEPSAESTPTPIPPVGTLPAEVAAAACALDAAVHAWDVAVATGQVSPLSSELADQLLPGARATAEHIRGFAYAAPLPEQPGDDSAAALLRYLGRDPGWHA